MHLGRGVAGSRGGRGSRVLLRLQVDNTKPISGRRLLVNRPFSHQRCRRPALPESPEDDGQDGGHAEGDDDSPDSERHGERAEQRGARIQGLLLYQKLTLGPVNLLLQGWRNDRGKLLLGYQLLGY